MQTSPDNETSPAVFQMKTNLDHRNVIHVYAKKIRTVLKSYRSESESEALSGAVSKLSRYMRANDPKDIAIVLESQVEHVVRRAREELFSEQLEEAHENLKASAWYQEQGTYELQSSEGGSQSFPWVVSDVLMRIVVNTSSCLLVPASRNSFSQRLGPLLLSVPHPGGGDQDGAQHGDTQVLTNLLRLMYDWIDYSREFLFVKDTEELCARPASKCVASAKELRCVDFLGYETKE
ncbi:hypothetical protein V5799_015167 [Amblyomma americanum]|uniref:RDRP C-terminal head domain-containing protein n=1 Tax=Amblyomma americanum TaxID=6943 RepID=A0AAQ4E0X9_AMBAM